jgi:hypothetical protein
MKRILTALLLLLSAAVSAASCADALPGPASKPFAAGVYDIKQPLSIPQYTNVGVPNAAGGVAYSGGRFIGAGELTTTLRFDPSFKGTMIETRPKCGNAPEVGGFQVDGRRGDNAGFQTADRADGIKIVADNAYVHDIGLINVPGTALTVDGHSPPGDQSDIFGCRSPRIENIFINQCNNGLVVNAGDAKLRSIDIVGTNKVGLTLNSPGAILISSHVWGTGTHGTACWIRQQCQVYGGYFEAARLGVHIQGHGSEITGLNIGPATCWRRGVLIEANGCKLRNVHGDVMAEDATIPEHGDIAGLEFAPWTVDNIVDCRFTVNGSSKGIIVAGNRQAIDTNCWMPLATKKAVNVKVLRTTGTKIRIVGECQNGTCLDLSESQLHELDGLGNDFELRVEQLGKGVLVKYPNNSPTYNLAPGTTLRINGELQGKPTDGWIRWMIEWFLGFVGIA